MCYNLNCPKIPLLGVAVDGVDGAATAAVVVGVAAPDEVLGFVGIVVVARFYVLIRNIEYHDPFHTPFDDISTYV
jgi:hypothetical protein